MSKNYCKNIIVKKTLCLIKLTKEKVILTKGDFIANVNINNKNFIINLETNDDHYVIKFDLKIKNNKKDKSSLGTFRKSILNWISGFKKEFVKILTFKGLGYSIIKSNKKKDTVIISLNKTHKEFVKIPKNINYEVDSKASTLKLSSINKNLLCNFVADEIQILRKYNIFTGFGILDSSIIYQRKKVRKVDSK